MPNANQPARRPKRRPNQRQVRNRRAPPRSTAVVTRAPAVKTNSARFSSSARGIVVEHKERFHTVEQFGGNGETASHWQINPANQSLFPWLSQIAPLYETYNFEALEVHYVTTAPVTTPGGIIIAVDYDPLDDPPTSQTELESYKGAISFPVYKATASLHCPRSDLNKRKTYYTKVSSSTVDAPPDRLNDVGNLMIRLDDGPAVAVVGKLYVKYRIRFQTPQLTSFNHSPGLSVQVPKPGTSPAVYTGTFLNGAAAVTAVTVGSILNATGNAGYTNLIENGINLITGPASQWTDAFSNERVLKFDYPGIYRLLVNTRFVETGSTNTDLENFSVPNFFPITSTNVTDGQDFTSPIDPKYTYSRTDNRSYAELFIEVFRAGVSGALRAANTITDGTNTLTRQECDITMARIAAAGAALPASFFPLIGVKMPGSVGTMTR